MESALNTITNILLSAGVNQKEVDHLLARFLEEEAYDYIKYMELCGISFEDQKIVQA